MISTSIRDATGSITTFNVRWLQAGLEAAVRKAGRDNGCLFEDNGCFFEEVINAVTYYLGCHHSPYVIDLSDLEEKVRETLRILGHGELAPHFCVMYPAQSVSLLTCAKDPTVRSERDFFARLGSYIEHVSRCRVERLCFFELEACEDELHRLGGGFPWGKPRDTRGKIVRFVRRELGRSNWPRQFHCSIT